MKQRVMITGYGCLTAVGGNIKQTWQAVQDGRTGIERINLWNVASWEYSLGAALKNYQPQKMLDDRKLLKMLSRHEVIGLNAVRQALEHSNLLSYRDNLTDPTDFNERTGIYVASPGYKFNQYYDLFPSFYRAQGDLKCYGESLCDLVHPMWLLQILSNKVLSYTGIQYGFKGSNHNIVNHGVSGIQSIAEAYSAIQNGKLDRAIVVGYESALEPQKQIYYANLGLLSKKNLLPFDVSRDGTILGEGAGSLILESLHSAQERKAKIYGEVVGQASTCEALGVFTIQKEGEGLVRSIQLALQQAKISTTAIGMITAHGNGTLNSDASEAYALAQLFGAKVPVTSFKWALGHTIAAAGVIETILTLVALREKHIPGIASLTYQAQDCEGIGISKQEQPTKSSIGLVLNRGFGGLNATLVIKHE